MRTLLTALSTAIAISTSATAGQLAEPVPILVNGRPIDVEHLGHTAACFADIDGDRRRDLLVGEYFRGRLSIYKNIGTDAEPEFDEPTLFQDGAQSGCIHASCCMGFGPQFVDFNGDGLEDILSGNWGYQVILFRRQPDGAFAAGEPVLLPDGLPLTFDYGVHAHAVNWDADGDLDLLAGTVPDVPAGNVWLAVNNGTATEPVFAHPVHLQAAGQPIVATTGGAAPVTADWDADGDLDLILGCADGSVLWFPNDGARAAPEFSEAQVLIDPPTETAQRGTHATPHVTDWNRDGRPDLLVGDVGDVFDKQLSADEVAFRNAARSEQGDILADWSQVFARFRNLKAANGDDDDIKSARQEMVRLKNVHEQCIRTEQAFTTGRQYHGRVWLFLGKQ